MKNNYKDTFRLEIKDAEKCIWHVTFEGADGTVYAGEVFTL